MKKIPSYPIIRPPFVGVIVITQFITIVGGAHLVSPVFLSTLKNREKKHNKKLKNSASFWGPTQKKHPCEIPGQLWQFLTVERGASIPKLRGFHIYLLVFPWFFVGPLKNGGVRVRRGSKPPIFDEDIGPSQLSVSAAWESTGTPPPPQGHGLTPKVSLNKAGY